MLSSLLLVIALCTDAFATSLTYGISKIKISLVSAIIISLTGAIFLAVALFFSGIVRQLVSIEICSIFSVVLLFLIGITSLFQNTIKSYLKAHKGKANVSFSLFSISFAIDIFLDEKAADADNSKTISPKEALMLAIALSVDSIAMGFSAGLSNGNCLRTIALCFSMSMLSIFCGGIIGSFIVKQTSINLGWLSGVMLILLSGIKLASLL